jgi:undecaprenyl diphosphate synthase
MTQSNLSAMGRPAHGYPTPGPDDRGGLHVAIIMDGNGRWAQGRGLPRRQGHRAGAVAVRRTVEAAPALGIRVLTLYAFSSDNWRRPADEVGYLMRLFRMYLTSEAERCVREGVRLSVIGRRDRLGPGILAAIESVEARTRAGQALHLQLAVDYSGRDAILEAARLHAGACGPVARPAPRPAPTRETFGRLLSRALHAEDLIPDVDLLIRTGGEQRLSDFLLWECAYAELVFTTCLWPDFDENGLESAVEAFRGRERRFGGLPPGPLPGPRPGPQPGPLPGPPPGSPPAPAQRPSPHPHTPLEIPRRRARTHG